MENLNVSNIQPDTRGIEITLTAAEKKGERMIFMCVGARERP